MTRLLVAHLAAHNAKHGSSSSTRALLNLALISCQLSEMDYPEEATAALLAGAMAAGNTGDDWGAAATGVPASAHPALNVLVHCTKASVIAQQQQHCKLLRWKAPDVTAKGPRVYLYSFVCTRLES